MRTLTPQEAKAFYDRFGARQDEQGFYEKPALDALVANADFAAAQRVFEFGCGTGRLADELLRRQLPATASYSGVDVSSTMIALASARLAAFAPRATVALTTGEPVIALPDASLDRVISTYVLDLLPEAAIRQFLAEAARALRREGLLCLAGITQGATPVSRAVMGAWRRIHAARPSWVGGCRPIDLRGYLDPAAWNPRLRTVAVAWGISSEVLVASRT